MGYNSIPEVEKPYLDRCSAGVFEIIKGTKSVEEVRAELWRWFKSCGVESPGDANGLDPGCMRRDHMELRNPVDGIQSCSRWVRGRIGGAGRAFPVWELVFYRGEIVHGEMVREMWAMNSHNLPSIGNRMMAPKDHPFWAELGVFGRPWGPWFTEELSGGGLGLTLISVGLKESIQLGAWKNEWRLDPLPAEITSDDGSSEHLAKKWCNNNAYTIAHGYPSAVIPRNDWTSVFSDQSSL